MKSYKRLLALLLALLLPVMSLAGCSKKVDQGDLSGGDIQQSAVSSLPDNFEDADNVSYVLVYNPDLYDEYSEINNELATGDFDQNVVDTSAVRAGGLPDDTESKIVPKSQGEMTGDFNFDGYDPSNNRAGVLVTPYSVGDTHDFFYQEMMMNTRTSSTFVCRYAGEHCYIWTMDGANDVTDDQVNTCGDKFDNEIYEKEVELFGEPRYAEDGGKIHLLLYDFDCMGQSITLGYFNLMDIVFTSSDISEAEAESNKINVDHAIVNVNTIALQNPAYEEYAYSTMAHEFQHLIFGSSIMCEPEPQLFNVWLNEALSGYTEEVFYPGIKASHIMDLQNSNMIRHGQSLYNFGTEDADIGVYGSVYLFSEFIRELGGEQVFHNIHDYLRTTDDSTPTDNGALYEALGPDVVSKINSAITLPDGVRFADEKEEFCSKLALAFYLSMLNGEIANPEAFSKIDAMTLLYDELDGCRIQGGGRVLLATKDGKFTIPAGADNGLVYIGLDENFKPVTGVIGG